MLEHLKHLTWAKFLFFVWGLTSLDLYTRLHEFCTIEPFSSFFTMVSWLSWEGCTTLLPFNLIKSFESLSTSYLSTSFSRARSSLQSSTITCTYQDCFSLLSFYEQVLSIVLYDFNTVTMTSWSISRVANESTSLSFEHLSFWCRFWRSICLLVSSSNSTLRAWFLSFTRASIWFHHPFYWEASFASLFLDLASSPFSSS